MSTASEDTVEEGNIRSLLRQLTYLAEELKAQRSFLARIPESILSSAPYEDSVSIRGRYVALLGREEDVNRKVIEHFASGSGNFVAITDEQPTYVSLGITDLVDRMIEARMLNVDRMPCVDDRAWSRETILNDQVLSLRAWAYRMVMQDADDLREIAIQFSEQKVTFKPDD
ncbi:MAG: hypothetical protein BMS9Abin05_1403 [Rhodothermia bacterium]|nr:MAG: hypothetical protein BMS9Abin05_1403 [Rhodothermia bacterium]